VMQQAGYDQDSIVQVARVHFFDGNTAAAHAHVLMAAYGITDPAKIAEALKNSRSYGHKPVFDAMRAVFPSLTAGEVLRILVDIYNDPDLVWRGLFNWAPQPPDDSVAAVLKQCDFPIYFVVHYLFLAYSIEDAVKWLRHNDYPLNTPGLLKSTLWDDHIKRDVTRIQAVVSALKDYGYTNGDIAEGFATFHWHRQACSIGNQAWTISSLWEYAGLDLGEIALAFSANEGRAFLTTGGGYEEMVEAFWTASSILRNPHTGGHGWEAHWSATQIAQALHAGGANMGQIARGFTKAHRGGTGLFTKADIYHALASIQGPYVQSIRSQLTSAQSDVSQHLPTALPFAALRIAGFSASDSARAMRELVWGWETASVNLMVAGYSFDDAFSAIWSVYGDVLKITLTLALKSIAGFLFPIATMPWYINLLIRTIIVDQLGS